MEKKKQKKNIVVRIFTSPIVLNLIIIGLVTAGIISGTMIWLKKYTKHDEMVIVPNIKNVNISDAERLLSSVGLEYEISSRVYVADGKQDWTTEQFPIPEARVKKGRKVFITIQTTTPPQIIIPDLTDYSKRIALARLNNLGFKDIKIIEKPSRYADIVLAIRHHGKEINSGDKIAKGAPLELVVGVNGDYYIEEDPMDSIQNVGEEDILDEPMMIDESFND